YALLRFFGYASRPGRTSNSTTKTTGCANGGANCPPPGGGGAAGGAGAGAAPTYEGYLVFGVVIAIALLVVVLLPRMQGYLLRRRDSRSTPSEPTARTALEEAL